MIAVTITNNRDHNENFRFFIDDSMRHSGLLNSTESVIIEYALRSGDYHTFELYLEGDEGFILYERETIYVDTARNLTFEIG